jgi:hypothetical protein
MRRSDLFAGGLHEAAQPAKQARLCLEVVRDRVQLPRGRDCPVLVNADVTVQGLSPQD